MLTAVVFDTTGQVASVPPIVGSSRSYKGLGKVASQNSRFPGNTAVHFHRSLTPVPGPSMQLRGSTVGSNEVLGVI